MRIATILIAIPLFSVAAGTGRVERCNFDLRAPSRQIALHATEGLDTAIEASIRADGTIPDLAGWRLLLWYGDAATNPPLGVAFTNISLSRGVARWDIPGAQIATNGRFAVQIVGQHTSGRSEEWARGWLAIDANSASSFAALTFGTPGWALATNVQAIAAAEAAARAAGDTIGLTNWQARVNALTNGAARGATALQPSWAATGTVHKADFANEAYQASVAIDSGTAVQLAPGVPDKLALDAATAHIDDPAAHPDIRDEVVGATNALVQTYLLGTNAWMSISNQTLTIWRETNGVPAALWSSAESEGGGGVDPAFTNAVWAALAAKGDAAWGTRAPDGSANPDPAYMTFLNAPATMHASGYQWATYGAYSVMAESGAVAYESGADGTARWGLDLQTNYIGFVRGGSVIVAARAGSITVSDGGSAEGIAEIVYSYTSGDFPVLWYAPALDVPFTVQPGVVWADNQDGTATVTAPATTPKGFWYATTTSSYDVMFDIRPPARLTGGVIGATNVLPVVYDSTIKISSGGKTYRIPAQEVVP